MNANPIMQVVYISNRPSTFAETLELVALLMPFIKSAVVCVPDKLESRFNSIRSSLPITTIPESHILSSLDVEKLPFLDHQTRNHLLRSQLVKSELIASRFIMSDDDSRPMKIVKPETFLKDGRFRRYFFYDLAKWRHNQTEFDAGQIATCAVLQHEGLEHLSYASHMPQIIDRELFLESSTFFEGHLDNHPLCEWSTYFNYAAHKKPDLFYEPEPYSTMCWPEHPLAWRQFVTQPEYLFENHTPSLYKRKAVFFDQRAASSSSIATLNKQNIQKAILWKKLTLSLMHPEHGSGFSKYLSHKTWINKLLKHILVN